MTGRLTMNILLIENKESLVSDLRKMLQNACLACRHCAIEHTQYGYSGLLIAQKQKPTIIIIDYLLPDANGLDITREIRRSPHIFHSPYIILNIPEPKKVNLDAESYAAGANDVLNTPYSVFDLMHKMKNLGSCLMFRNERKDLQHNIFTFNNLKIDDNSKLVHYQGELINLERKEYDLMLYLIKNVNKALNRDHILADIWDNDYKGITNRVVDSCICKLKSKIPMLSQHIEGVFKVGYRLNNAKIQKAAGIPVNNLA
jgi:DNA-binding response OmpR family regulator